MDTTKKSSNDFSGEFHLYYPILIKQVSFLLGDSIAADDIVQETLIKYFYTERENIQNPKAWLIKVAVNSTYNYLRSEKNRKKREEIDLPQSTFDVEETVLKNQEAFFVREAIAQLSDRDRMLILLKYTGYTYHEISQILNLEETSVGTLLARAKKKFKEILLSLKGSDIGAF
ncbi:MAG: sigma-70 family RNA polymerase sigma factor [Bacillota bacterium]